MNEEDIENYIFSDIMDVHWKMVTQRSHTSN